MKQRDQVLFAHRRDKVKILAQNAKASGTRFDLLEIRATTYGHETRIREFLAQFSCQINKI